MIKLIQLRNINLNCLTHLFFAFGAVLQLFCALKTDQIVLARHQHAVLLLSLAGNAHVLVAALLNRVEILLLLLILIVESHLVHGRVPDLENRSLLEREGQALDSLFGQPQPAAVGRGDVFQIKLLPDEDHLAV